MIPLRESLCQWIPLSDVLKEIPFQRQFHKGFLLSKPPTGSFTGLFTGFPARGRSRTRNTPVSHPPNDNLIARGWNDPMNNLWNGTCTSTGLCTRSPTHPRHHAVHRAIHQRLNSHANDPMHVPFHGLSMESFQPRARSSKQRNCGFHSQGCSSPMIRLRNHCVNSNHEAMHGATSKVLFTRT